MKLNLNIQDLSNISSIYPTVGSKINHELKSKVEWACRLNNTKPIFINGSLLKLEPTNIGYIEPHRAIINNKTYLLFNGHEFVYYRDLNAKFKRFY